MHWSRYMNEPSEPEKESMAKVEIDLKIDTKWIVCPYCGKRQFPVMRCTRISNLIWRCKGSNCKKDVFVQI